MFKSIFIFKRLFNTTRVKKSESYSVNLHDGFPGKSMKNVPNIRLFSRIYTKKIHLSYFTFDSVIRTAYTYNSIKKNNRFRFVFNSNINQKYIGKVLVHEHSWTFMNFYERLDHGYSWTFMNIHEKFSTNIHVLSWTKKNLCWFQIHVVYLYFYQARDFSQLSLWYLQN